MTVVLRPTASRRLRWRDRLRDSTATGPLTVGVFGLAFSAAASWIPSPWYDEAATISAATRSLPQLFALLQNVDAVHGVYYTLMHVWLGLVGYSPFALRLPSAIAVGLAAAALVVLVRQLVSRRTALVAGIVFCLLPRVTWMGTEGRSYALSTLLAVIMTLAFIGAWRWGARDRRQRALAWIGYGVLAWIGCATFLYLALLVVAHGVTAIVLAAQQRGRAAGHGLRGWALAAVGAALTALPLVVDEVQQSSQITWIDPLGATTAHQVLVGQWFLGNTAFAWAGWSLILLGVAATVAATVAPLLRGGRPPGASVRLLAFALPWMLVPTAALLIATAVATPLYSARYLTFSAPAAAILIAVALTAPRRLWIAVVGLLLCAGLTVPSYLHQRSEHGKQDSSWGQVAALIAAERAAEPTGQADAVIYGPLRRHPDADMAMLALAYPQQFSGLIDLKAGETAGDSARLWARRIPLAASESRLDNVTTVWLITSDKRDWRPGVQEQLATWGYYLDDQWHVDGVNVVRYERG